MTRELLDFEDYKHIFMKTRKEFVKDNKIKDNNFTKDVEYFMENLGLDPESMRSCDGSDSYQISLLLEPIIAIIMKDCKDNPVYKKNKGISITDIIDYNKIILKKINKLPEDLKYEIKQTRAYDYNYKLNILMPMLVERLDLLFKLVISESNIESGDGIVQIIKQIDEWIINLKDVEIKQDEIKEIMNDSEVEFDPMDWNTQDTTNSLIDSALKSSYNNQIGLTKLAREKLKYEGISKGIIDTDDKMSREEIINWIFYNGKKAPEDTLNYIKEKHKEIDLKYRRVRSSYDSLKIENRIKRQKEIDKQNFEEIRCNSLEIVDKSIRRFLEELKNHDGDYGEFNNYNEMFIYVKNLLSDTDINTLVLEDIHSILYTNILEINNKMIQIKKKNIECFCFENEIEQLLNDVDDELTTRINENKKYLNRLYKVVLEDFKNTKDNLDREKIKESLYMALGQSIKGSLDKSKKTLKSDIYYVDEIVYR